MVLLSFLAIFTSGSIRNATRSKMRLQSDFDRGSEIREVLKLMKRDIELAFQMDNVTAKIFKKAQQEVEAPPNQPGAPAQPAAAPGVPDFAKLGFGDTE